MVVVAGLEGLVLTLCGQQSRCLQSQILAFLLLSAGSRPDSVVSLGLMALALRLDMEDLAPGMGDQSAARVVVAKVAVLSLVLPITSVVVRRWS